MTTQMFYGVLFKIRQTDKKILSRNLMILDISGFTNCVTLYISTLFSVVFAQKYIVVFKMLCRD